MGPPRKDAPGAAPKAAAAAGNAAPKPPAGSRRTARPYHPLVDAILAVIRSIPRGRTAAYGQVAALAGKPRAARQVARILHSLSETQGLPWHRVINRNGRISLPMQGSGGRQAALLRREGVGVDDEGRVDVAASAWRPKRRPDGS